MRAGQAIAAAAARLARAHVASPRVDAELLAAFVLGVARPRLALVDDLTDAQERTYRELTSARARRIPLQHLTGAAPFRRLELAVGPGVFLPRPETELVVQWGLAWLAERPGGPAGAVVVDLCAGSGAIAASVASEAPGTVVYAVEHDPAAIGWLRRNVDAYGVRVVDGDATDAQTLAELRGHVDLVLTNPPYVPEVAASGLAPEVTEHDPHQAVFGGEDGLDVIRPLVGVIAGLLRPGGAVALEHDETHAYVVPTLVHADGRFRDIQLRHDLARRPRFTTGIRVDDEARMADLAP